MPVGYPTRPAYPVARRPRLPLFAQAATAGGGGARAIHVPFGRETPPNNNDDDDDDNDNDNDNDNNNNNKAFLGGGAWPGGLLIELQATSAELHSSYFHTVAKPTAAYQGVTSKAPMLWVYPVSGG